MSIDYEALFSKTLYEEMGRIFGEHGITEIHEDELDDTVAECLRKVYWPSIAEFRKTSGRPPALPTRRWRPAPPDPERLRRKGTR